MEIGRIEVGLIGLGGIGMAYDLGASADRIRSHAKALTQHPNFELKFSVDPDEKARAQFTDLFHSQVFSSIEVASRYSRPDLIVIATPTETHRDVIKDVINCIRPKVILLEKPLATNIGDAEFIVELTRKKGIKLFVNFIRRSDPGAIRVKRELIDPLGDSGFNGYAYYSKGLLHNGCHLIDLLTWWLGKALRFSELHCHRASSSPDTVGSAKIYFERGFVVFEKVSLDDPRAHSVELFGRSGYLRYCVGDQDIHWVPVGHRGPGSVVMFRSNLERYQYNVYSEVCKVFKEAEVAAEAMICDGDFALINQKFIEMIVEQCGKYE